MLISAFPNENKKKEAQLLVLLTMDTDATACTHALFTNMLAFFNHYRTVTDPTGNDDDNDSIFAIPFGTDAERQTALKFVPAFNKTIVVIFYKPWNTQLEVYKEQDCRIAMDKFAKQQLETTATNDATTYMDTEPTVTAASMDTLIERKIHEKTRKLQSQVEKLTSQLQRSRPSNTDGKNKRGATKGRASTKKKSSPTKKKTKAPVSPTTRCQGQTPSNKKQGSAAVAANASKKSPAKKNSNGKPGKKKPPSNKGKKQAYSK